MLKLEITIEGPARPHPRGEGYDPQRETLARLALEVPDERAWELYRFVTAGATIPHQLLPGIIDRAAALAGRLDDEEVA